MKKHLIILSIFALSMPALAQDTNEFQRPKGDRYGEHRSGDRGERRRDLSPEEKEKMQEQRLQLMEKTLKDIGVTEEQKAQIVELQKKQREQMKTAYQMVEDNKRKVSELENGGASEEKIFEAIDAVSDAQSEQMKLLVRNRMQMERILGKEKFKLFMDSARMKWKEHGRRGGSGMPPPPPNQESSQTPPTPKPMPPTP